MSMFGASVYANKSDKLARGQVVEVALGPEKTTAIVRSEKPGSDNKTLCRYGLEFIKPTDAFLSEVRLITETSQRLVGDDVRREQLWLRTS